MCPVYQILTIWSTSVGDLDSVFFCFFSVDETLIELAEFWFPLDRQQSQRLMLDLDEPTMSFASVCSAASSTGS